MVGLEHLIVIDRFGFMFCKEDHRKHEECFVFPEVRDAGAFWSPTLPTKLAEMQLGNVGMISRAVVDQGFLIDSRTFHTDVFLFFFIYV